MAIEVSIFGFGDDRPACFQGRNQMQLTLETPLSVRTAIHQAGFVDSTGLVLMINDHVVAEQDWGTTLLEDGDNLRDLSAFEGG